MFYFGGYYGHYNPNAFEPVEDPYRDYEDEDEDEEYEEY